MKTNQKAKILANLHIRPMRLDDYEQVAMLWQQIEEFYIRSIDDSKEGVARFLTRNPNTSVVAVLKDEDQKEWIIGSILCGHDGRYGSLYHVCVHKDFRQMGIGSRMVEAALNALKKEQISSISLIAFSENIIGNTFWKKQGWASKPNANRYEFSLNPANISHKIDSPNPKN